jgi:shikimate 5-dehydrogenase
LLDIGATVTVTARRDEQAVEVMQLDQTNVTTAGWGKRVACDLVVQTTPLDDDTLPDAYRTFTAGRAAIELRYGQPESSFIKSAKQAGVPAFDGLGMLLHQAALSFQIWTGVSPSLEVMREAAEAELARRARA